MELPLKINNFDRFSNLPDSIIHNILSVVHIRYIACVGSLSKRLRQVCLSMPYLNVDIEEFEDQHKLDCFNNFMYKYWALRNGTELLYLRIRLPSYKFKCDMDFHVTTWIDCATMCHVQELDLDIAMNKPFYLSSRVLNSRLRMLKLDLHNGVLMFAKEEFGSLQYLSLKSFKTVDFPLGEWISLYCKAIKRLNLEAFLGIRDLAITSSSLEDIKILTSSKMDNLCHIQVFAEKLTTITIKWWNTGYFAKSFTIFAPNLLKLTYVGDSACYLCQGEFKSLVTARIIVRPLSPYFPNRRDTTDSFKKFFWLLNKAKRIDLSGSFVEMLCEQDYAPTMALKNLRHLKVCTGYHKEWFSFPALASFLKKSPNLRDLRIMGDFFPYINMVPVKEYSFDTKCWESEELMFVHGLKVVAIELSGHNNEVELIKYLLKHAKELEKITIFYSPQGPSSFWKKIRSKVEAFKKASSNAGVYFLPR